MTKRFVGIALIAILLGITGWVLAQQSNDLVLFEATFDDGTIPDNLEITGGDTTIESGVLTVTSETSQLIAFTGAEAAVLADYSMEIRVQITSGELWIQSRGSGSTYCGGYYLLVKPESLAFDAAIGDEDCVFHVIESTQDVEFSGDFIVLRLDTSGKTVTAFADDEMLFSFDDDAISMGLPILSIIPGSSGTASIAIDSIRILNLNVDAIATATAAVQPTDTPEMTATLAPSTSTEAATTEAPTERGVTNIQMTMTAIMENNGTALANIDATGTAAAGGAAASPTSIPISPTMTATPSPVAPSPTHNPDTLTATYIAVQNATTQALIEKTMTAVAVEETANASPSEPVDTPVSPTNTVTPTPSGPTDTPTAVNTEAATDTLTPTMEATHGATSTVPATLITTDVPTGTPWPTAQPPATATITPTLDPDRFIMPPAPQTLGEATVEPERVISALRALGLIPDGGSMLFEEDFVGVSRVGDWFQPFPLQNPVKDMVLAAELTYYGGGFGATQTCQLSLRVGRDEREIARTFLDVGLTTRGELYASETIQTGKRSIMHNTTSLGVGVGQPTHLLIIVINNQLTVYANGGLRFENITVVDRSGIVGLSISSTDPNTRCEARQVWGYSLDN